MALFKRGPDKPEPPVRAGGAEVVYARVIDGEHLWLAVRGDGPLALRRDGADDLQVPSVPGADDRGPLATARYPLAAALAEVDAKELELRLFVDDLPAVHAAAVPQGPGLDAPLTRDRRWQFRVGSAAG